MSGNLAVSSQPLSGSYVSSVRTWGSVFPLPFSRTLRTSREIEFFSGTIRNSLRVVHCSIFLIRQSLFEPRCRRSCHPPPFGVFGQEPGMNII